MDLNTATCDDSVMANIRILHSEEGVATITLDRPHKKNALSVALREEWWMRWNTFVQTTRSIASS